MELLTKPYTRDELARKVRQVLADQKQRPTLRRNRTSAAPLVTVSNQPAPLNQASKTCAMR